MHTRNTYYAVICICNDQIAPGRTRSADPKGRNGSRVTVITSVIIVTINSIFFLVSTSP